MIVQPLVIGVLAAVPAIVLILTAWKDWAPKRGRSVAADHPWVEDHAAILAATRLCLPVGARDRVSDYDLLRIISAASREIVNRHPQRASSQLLSILQIGPNPRRVGNLYEATTGGARHHI